MYNRCIKNDFYYKLSLSVLDQTQLLVDQEKLDSSFLVRELNVWLNLTCVTYLIYEFLIY